jgi:hypothetical protein
VIRWYVPWCCSPAPPPKMTSQWDGDQPCRLNLPTPQPSST